MSAQYPVTCTVYRRTDDGEGPYPQGDYLPHLTEVPCRVWQQAGVGNREQREPEVSIDTWYVMTPHGYDITARDRIAVAGLGLTIDLLTWNPDVGLRRHHAQGMGEDVG